MSDDVEKKIADLQRQIDELRKAQEPKEPFIPKREWQKIDYTEQMRMPASAAQAMAAIVPDVKRSMSREDVESGWARSKTSSPSGLGPPSGGNWDKGERREEPPVEERSKFEAWRQSTSWGRNPIG